MPSTQSIRVIGDALEGRRVLALIRQAYPACTLFLLFLGTAHVLKREAEPQALRPAPKGGEPKTVDLLFPECHGVAALRCRTLLRSHVGKAGLVLSLMISFGSLGLMRGPLSHSMIWIVPAAFTLLSISAYALQLNQFGLDGPGVKPLLLLPIPSHDLLGGKALGLAIYGAVSRPRCSWRRWPSAASSVQHRLSRVFAYRGACSHFKWPLDTGSARACRGVCP